MLSQGKPLRALVKMVRGGSYWPTRRLVPLVKKYPVMVSNPALQKRYGGVLVPHARVDSGAGSPHTTGEPTIAFVGTNRPHKGVEVLRESARTAGPTPMSLTITDIAPEDATPNENWVGQTSLSRGVDIVKQSDIVVIPSVRTSAYSAAQLPVKIIDAMLAGRAIVVSDFEPLAWAIGDFGIVVPPGDVARLSLALEELRDPARRADLGGRARERALATFTVPSVASQFAEACRGAVAADADRGE
ncbi:glycosyltransferase family 1 protein [Microbacterium sorbitolivorans]|uniref:Glycosyltransferase family 1 protein n=1 Tax=Microbacterium sorbitolivorans TaxID=1867410 RepID=A0A367Y1E1_9MICO|nr:glycosyltransferase family 1 protein [Microbacterium sorbitolivorans]